MTSQPSEDAAVDVYNGGFLGHGLTSEYLKHRVPFDQAITGDFSKP